MMFQKDITVEMQVDAGSGNDIWESIIHKDEIAQSK